MIDELNHGMKRDASIVNKINELISFCNEADMWLLRLRRENDAHNDAVKEKCGTIFTGTCPKCGSEVIGNRIRVKLESIGTSSMDCQCPVCGDNHKKEKENTSSEKKEPCGIEHQIYLHLNTHGYNLLKKEAREDLAQAIKEHIRETIKDMKVYGVSADRTEDVKNQFIEELTK